MVPTQSIRAQICLCSQVDIELPQKEVGSERDYRRQHLDNTNLTATGGHGSVVAWAIATPDGSGLWQYVRVSLVGCHGPLRSARYRMQWSRAHP